MYFIWQPYPGGVGIGRVVAWKCLLSAWRMEEKLWKEKAETRTWLEPEPTGNRWMTGLGLKKGPPCREGHLCSQPHAAVAQRGSPAAQDFCTLHRSQGPWVQPGTTHSCQAWQTEILEERIFLTVRCYYECTCITYTNRLAEGLMHSRWPISGRYYDHYDHPGQNSGEIVPNSKLPSPPNTLDFGLIFLIPSFFLAVM